MRISGNDSEALIVPYNTHTHLGDDVNAYKEFNTEHNRVVTIEQRKTEMMCCLLVLHEIAQRVLKLSATDFCCSALKLPIQYCID